MPNPTQTSNVEKIERMLGVKAYNSFGMTEMNGPGVAFECTEQDGMHFWEDATWSKSLIQNRRTRTGR